MGAFGMRKGEKNCLLDVADVGQVTVFSVEIETIAHQEEVIAVQRTEVRLVFHSATPLFVDRNSGGYLGGTFLAERIADSLHGETGIQHIINDQNLLTIALGKSSVPLELAGALRSLVTGDADGLQLEVCRQTTEQVGGIPDSSIEQAERDDRFLLAEEFFNLAGNIADGLMDLFRRIKRFDVHDLAFAEKKI